MSKMREKIYSDPAAHEAYKAKERERYQRRKLEGKIKTVHNLSDRAARDLRRKWRLDKRRLRKQKKECGVEKDDDVEGGVNLPETPEATPTRREVEVRNENQLPSHQKRAGRRKLRRDERKAYRTINKQKETIQRLQNEIKKLKRRNKKLFESTSADNIDRNNNEIRSPRTRAVELVKLGDQRKIKRQLTFGFSVSDGIREKMKSSKVKKKRLVSEIISERLLKKYGLINI